MVRTHLQGVADNSEGDAHMVEVLGIQPPFEAICKVCPCHFDPKCQPPVFHWRPLLTSWNDHPKQPPLKGFCCEEPAQREQGRDDGRGGSRQTPRAALRFPASAAALPEPCSERWLLHGAKVTLQSITEFGHSGICAGEINAPPSSRKPLHLPAISLLPPEG